ncbi:MAG: response regulator transcription factor [Acidimicrobiales bacterium]
MVGVDSRQLRVVVADDSILLRHGVVSLLTSRGLQVVAQVGDGDQLMAAVAQHAPDVAIVDIRMPPTGTDEGLRAAAALAQMHPGVAVLVLSEFLELKYATQLLEDGTPGRGYLLKQTVTELDDFVGAVRRLADGQSVVDPEIVRLAMGRARKRDPLGDLGGREREILALMAEGRSNAGIAELLYMSPRTVEGHIANVFLKLGLEHARDDNRRVLAVLTYLNNN